MDIQLGFLTLMRAAGLVPPPGMYGKVALQEENLHLSHSDAN